MSVATNPMLFMRLLPNLLRDVFLQKQSHSTEEDESVQNFFHRHIGSYFTETFVAPFIVGVYAGNPKKLSAQTCFKTLWKLDREYGSLVRGMLVQRLPHLVANEIEEQSRQLHLHLKNERESQLVFSHLRRIQSRGGIMSFKSGLQTLTDALASRYQSNLRFCSKVVRLVPKKDDNNTNPQIEVTFEKNESGDRQYETIVADYVISCLPSNELALILRSTHSEISDLLNQIPFVSLAVVNLGYSTNVIPPSLKGFGYLVPPHERQEILGVTFDSEIFPEVVGSFERKNSSSITVMIGGDLDNHDRVIDVTNTSEKELLDIALRNIRQHLGIDQTPTHAVVKVCRDAIPQYTVGHLQRLDKIKELLQNQLPRMYLAGNSYNGIGVPDCVASASRAATTVVTELFKDHQTTL
jgi:oxygen-dependent protoporphyrinogen oxidase